MPKDENRFSRTADRAPHRHEYNTKGNKTMLERETEWEEITNADLRVDPLRVVCHAADQQIRDCDPVMQVLLLYAELSPEHFSLLNNMKLSFLLLGGRMNRYAALYGREDDTVRLRPATYELNQYLQNMTDLLDRQLGVRPDYKISFQSRTDGELYAEFDADRLSAILFNLVDNAIQHGHTDNKNVYISLRETATTFTVSVKDKGKGIPREKVKTLFSQYAHLPAVPPVYPSSLEGLGLALCLKYAEEMQGKLTFENQKIGAKFSLTLPKQSDRQHRTFQEPRTYQPDRVTMMQYIAASLLLLKSQDAKAEKRRNAK